MWYWVLNEKKIYKHYFILSNKIYYFILYIYFYWISWNLLKAFESKSAALLMRSVVISSPILLTISFVSLLSWGNGGIVVQIVGKKVHNIIPKKTIPKTETSVVTIFKITAKIILDAGKNVLMRLIGETVDGDCLTVGIKNPSNAAAE